MTQEDKDLLLKDLCARLPYGVICEIYNDISSIKEKLLIGGILHFDADSICVKPYLRPMSSMTEEEKNEMRRMLSPEGTALHRDDGIAIPMNHFGDFVSYEYMSRIIDWLISYHFDYRGLIPKGLAIEVTKENNPYK